MCDNLFDDVSLDKQVDSFMKIETLLHFCPTYIMNDRDGIESEYENSTYNNYIYTKYL